MNKKSKLSCFAYWIATNKIKALFIAIGVTIVMCFGASRLRMEMSFIQIFPDNTKKFQDLNKIIKEFPFASAITIILDAKHIENNNEAKALLIKTANQITKELNKSEYVSSILDKMDLALIKEHGLILSEPEDINRVIDIYKEKGIVSFLKALNNDFEKEYSGNEENLKDDESQASNQFRSLENLLLLLNTAIEGTPVTEAQLNKTLDKYLYGEEYFFNKDSKQLALYILPTFIVDDLELLVPGVNYIEDEAIEIAERNGIKAGLTGLMTVSRDEMVTSSKGFIISMIIAVILILSILILILKMKSVPIIIGIPLFTGIIWTTGVSGFLIGRLNLVTAMYMIALIGLGVDYAIHLLTNFTIEREAGKKYIEALTITYEETGKGVITGALTTSVAFFALLASETKFMKELGVIAGLGIICVLLSTLLITPLLLTFRESRKKEFKKGKVKASIASGLGRRINKSYKVIIAVSLLVITGISFKSKDVKIMDNLMEMEAKGLTSIKLQDEMIEEFEMAPDPLMIISDSLNEAKILSKKLEKLSSVKSVDSIAPYLLTNNEYIERVDLLNIFKKNLNVPELPTPDKDELLEEIYRLEANLLEMSELAFMGGMLRLTNSLNEITGFDNNNEKFKESVFDKLLNNLENNNFNLKSAISFQEDFTLILTDKLYKMANTEKVTVEMLPENFAKSFISKDGNKFLLNITPTQNPWKKDFRDIYQRQVESITDKATGMVMISDILTIMVSIDGVKTSLIALFIVFILLVIDFRNIKLAIFTLFPLLMSFVCLFAIMAITGIKLDFVNIVAIPLLIGIGIDDAVHINHRYLIEGKENMENVLKHAGSAVLLTSITTTIGFASFIPSPMTGLSNSGIVFGLAIVLAFTFSILFYPSLLILVKEKLNLNISSWKRRKR